MNKWTTFAYLGLSLIGLNSCATDVSRTPTTVVDTKPVNIASSPLQINEEEVVAARQAGMTLSASALTAMVVGMQAGEGAGENGLGVHKAHANALYRWSRALPGLFRDGGGLESSDAKPGIWADRTGFETRASAYETATSELRKLAFADDRDGFIAQLDIVRAECKACHELYKD